MSMTYRQLAAFIAQNMTEEQKDQAVTILSDSDEFSALSLITPIRQNIGDDVLDHGHWFLIPSMTSVTR